MGTRHPDVNVIVNRIVGEMDDIDKSTEILPLREPNSDFGSLWINPSDKDPTGVS